MSNIIQFRPEPAKRSDADYTSVIEDLGDYTAGNFTVKSAPVQYREDAGEMLTDGAYRVLYREDTGEVLNVVRSRYKLAQYVDAWKAAEKILIKSGLDLTGLERRMEQTANGGRAYAIYTLPMYSFDMGNGDESILQITAYTSFDGSWCFCMEVGAVRMMCLNRQVAIQGFSLYKSKHTPSLNISHGVTKIAAALTVYEAEQERWKRWVRTPISDRAAFNVFAGATRCKFPKARPDLSVAALLGEPEVYRNKSLGYIWNQYQSEKSELGANQWAVFNAMTHWATHAALIKTTAAGNISAIKIRRGEQVRNAAKLLLAA